MLVKEYKQKEKDEVVDGNQLDLDYKNQKRHAQSGLSQIEDREASESTHLLLENKVNPHESQKKDGETKKDHVMGDASQVTHVRVISDMDENETHPDDNDTKHYFA